MSQRYLLMSIDTMRFGTCSFGDDYGSSHRDNGFAWFQYSIAFTNVHRQQRNDWPPTLRSTSLHEPRRNSLWMHGLTLLWDSPLAEFPTCLNTRERNCIDGSRRPPWHGAVGSDTTRLPRTGPRGGSAIYPGDRAQLDCWSDDKAGMVHLFAGGQSQKGCDFVRGSCVGVRPPHCIVGTRAESHVRGTENHGGMPNPPNGARRLSSMRWQVAPVFVGLTAVRGVKIFSGVGLSVQGFWLEVFISHR